MSYITEIFERLDLQQIRSFLLHGVESVEEGDKSYKQRVKEAHDPAIELIEKSFKNTDDYEKITGKVYNYMGVVEDVYMEIGMQCGAIIMAELLSNFIKRQNPNYD